MNYIEIAKQDGAQLIYGGNVPSTPSLANGWFIEPTIFTGVTQNMRIANEEVFGPILSVIQWDDEDQMFDQVNAVEYGLTASIWTTNLSKAHRAASRVQAGYWSIFWRLQTIWHRS
jgi:betaine-aldehyde dehydrogenase